MRKFRNLFVSLMTMLLVGYMASCTLEVPEDETTADGTPVVTPDTSSTNPEPTPTTTNPEPTNTEPTNTDPEPTPTPEPTNQYVLESDDSILLKVVYTKNGERANFSYYTTESPLVLDNLNFNTILERQRSLAETFVIDVNKISDLVTLGYEPDVESLVNNLTIQIKINEDGDLLPSTDERYIYFVNKLISEL